MGIGTTALINFIVYTKGKNAKKLRQGKDRKQQVDVYFNFIGNCQVPQRADMEKNDLKMV